MFLIHARTQSVDVPCKRGKRGRGACLGDASRQQHVKPWAAMAHWMAWLARDGKRASGNCRPYFENKRTFE